MRDTPFAITSVVIGAIVGAVVRLKFRDRWAYLLAYVAAVARETVSMLAWAAVYAASTPEARGLF